MRDSRDRESMPLYEYECDACGRRFERIQKFSDPLVTVCPTCGGTVRKLFSSPAIQFKGSGFYITDYAKPGASGSEADKTEKGEKTDKSDKKSADPASSGSGDSGDAKAKPAAGTDGGSGDTAKKAEPAKAPADSTGKTKT
jgi:putative FmdB family regulatory protein